MLEVSDSDNAVVPSLLSLHFNKVRPQIEKSYKLMSNDEEVTMHMSLCARVDPIDADTGICVGTDMDISVCAHFGTDIDILCRDVWHAAKWVQGADLCFMHDLIYAELYIRPHLLWEFPHSCIDGNPEFSTASYLPPWILQHYS